MVRFKQVSCGENACQTPTRAPTPPSCTYVRQVRKHLGEAALPTQEWHSEHSHVSLQSAQEMKAFLQALKQMLHGRLKLSRDSCHRGSPVRCHLARAAPLAQRGPHNLVWAHCTPAWRSNKAEASQEEGGLG